LTLCFFSQRTRTARYDTLRLWEDALLEKPDFLCFFITTSIASFYNVELAERAGCIDA